MTTSSVISDAWGALKQEKFTQPGVYLRRVFADASYSIFAAIERPSGLPKIYIDLNVPFKRQSVLELRGVSLKIEELENGKTRIRLELSQSSYAEIYAILVEDCVLKVLSATSDSEAMERLTARILHWQKFMQLAGPAGLTAEQQQGLFGELLILKAMLNTVGEVGEVLLSWKGPSAENQDFSRKGHAIEVKTSAANDGHSVLIANERQLDDAGLNSLVLCHLLVDIRSGIGTSLPDLVAEINVLIGADLRPSFEDQLILAGYHHEQRHLYVTSYVERARNFYRIGKVFPRIVPSALLPGVSETRYRINLSGCENDRVVEGAALTAFMTDSL